MIATSCCLLHRWNISYLFPWNSISKWTSKGNFYFFLSNQLKGLNDPDSLAFPTYEEPGNCEFDDIFVCLCKMFFSIVKERHSLEVTEPMLNIMTSSKAVVSQDFLDTILCHILEPYKSENRPAYALACGLIRRSIESLEPYIQAFVDNTSHGKTSGSNLTHRICEIQPWDWWWKSSRQTWTSCNIDSRHSDRTGRLFAGVIRKDDKGLEGCNQKERAVNKAKTIFTSHSQIMAKPRILTLLLFLLMFLNSFHLFDVCVSWCPPWSVPTVLADQQ